MQKDVILTEEGLQNLKEELEHLQTAKRREVAERIKEAREFGDISENSEYDDAKNEQAMLEGRIAQLEERLRSARVLDAGELGTDVVRVGSKGDVPDEKNKKESVVIVGATEAARPERLSNESPVGKALMGHKKGDTVEVALPNGKKRKLKITKIAVGVRGATSCSRPGGPSSSSFAPTASTPFRPPPRASSRSRPCARPTRASRP